jgi:hypothetical protein
MVPYDLIKFKEGDTVRCVPHLTDDRERSECCTLHGVAVCQGHTVVNNAGDGWYLTRSKAFRPTGTWYLWGAALERITELPPGVVESRHQVREE